MKQIILAGALLAFAAANAARIAAGAEGAYPVSGFTNALAARDRTETSINKSDQPIPPDSWVTVAKSRGEDLSILVDLSTIHAENGVRRASIRRVPAPHTVKDASDSAGQWISYYVETDAWNCSEETTRSETLITHFEDSTALGDADKHSVANPLQTAWHPAGPPQSAEGDTLRFVCGWDYPQGSRWMRGAHGGGLAIYLDLANIVIEGRVRHVWSKWVYAGNTQRGEGSNADKWLKLGFHRTAYDCGEKTYHREITQYAYTDGSMSAYVWSLQAAPFMPIRQNTFAEYAIAFTCDWKPK